jgi:hypothetical protein
MRDATSSEISGCPCRAPGHKPPLAKARFVPAHQRHVHVRVREHVIEQQTTHVECIDLGKGLGLQALKDAAGL